MRQNGRRGVLVSILKAGNASTISVVDGIRGMLHASQQTLPPQLRIQPLADQSIFVKAAVAGVIREAVIAACLTALMILVFLGSWRSTLIIAVSIPLSILTSIMALSFLGQTINIMTLGGLALAVGILVDDATVTIENMERYLEEGHGSARGDPDGASQIAVPALVSTLCICIVFVPMFLLTGVARYLFVPLAEAVVFAMLASYVLSRTLVPTMAMYLLRAKPHNLSAAHATRWCGCSVGSSGDSNVCAAPTPARWSLCSAGGRCSSRPSWFAASRCSRWRPGSARISSRIPIAASSSCICVPRQARGSRRPRGSRSGRGHDPPGRSGARIWTRSSTISVCRTARINLTYSDLRRDRRRGRRHHGFAEAGPPADRRLRQGDPAGAGREFPGVDFYSLPADMITQILNFGLPAPIDIQIDGANVDGNRTWRTSILEQVRKVPGVVDARIQQRFDYPMFEVDVDRTKAQQNGLPSAMSPASVLTR